MEQNPSSKVDISWASKEITNILYNWKVHYRAHNSLPSSHNLDQIIPVHAISFLFFAIHVNIILPPTPCSTKWPLPPYVPHDQNITISLISSP